MRAFRFDGWHKGAGWADVPLPEPVPGEVLVRMGGAGVCRTDLHLLQDWDPVAYPKLAAWPIPFTLGHENAGWIEVGNGGGLESGTPVVVSPKWGCGYCRACREGDNNYCERPGILSGGMGRDGGLAEYLVAPASAVLPLKRLEPWQAAPLTDAGLTAYHAVKLCLPRLTPDAAVVVLGIGGLGHMAVAYLRELTGCQIIAVDIDPQALEIADLLGADLCLESNGTTASEIRLATRDLGAMAILDFVGIDATVNMAVQAARRRGLIVVAGVGGGTLALQHGGMPAGCTLRYILGGSTRELAEVVALAESGRVRPRIETFRLDEVEQVLDRVKRGKLRGRAVMVPAPVQRSLRSQTAMATV